MTSKEMFNPDNPQDVTDFERHQNYVLQWFMDEIEEWQSQIEGTPNEKQMDELRHIYGFGRARMDELYADRDKYLAGAKATQSTPYEERNK